MKKYLPQLLLFLLIIGFSWVYDYPSITGLRPQSLHAWRQCDGASLALNYYRNGMDFFEPEAHNLTSDQGTSGKAATSEIPLLYYFIAILYHIFGYHECIFRIVTMLFFFLGLYYLFRIIRTEFNDSFWAVSIPLFIFTSPVLVYYANNFLSNIPAFSLSLIAWYYILKYFHNQKRQSLIAAFVLFGLAAAFKITALFSFFALAGYFILEWSGFISRKDKSKYFNHPGLSITAGLLILIPAFSWILYARKYNLIHDTTYFSTTFFPVWTLKMESIQSILTAIKENLLTDYFHPVSLILLGVLFMICLFYIPKKNNFYKIILLLLFVEILIFITLQFWTFRDHDYYVINMYIFPVLILLSSLSLLQSIRLKPFLILLLKLSFSLFVLFNLLHAQNRMEHRYTERNDHYTRNIDFYTLTPSLREANINSGDKVISFSDFGHTTLYLMDQPGWTRYADMRYNKNKPILYNRTAEDIKHSCENGAKYMIINGFEDLYKHTFLQEFTHKLHLVYRNILIFDLQSTDRNFHLKDREILNYSVCTAETLNLDKTKYQDPASGRLFGNPGTRSENTSFEGSYSLALNAEKPFGASFKMHKMQQGESVKALVWIKGIYNKGGIVARAEDYNKFHRTRVRTTGNKKNNWIEIMMEFFIPFEMNGEDLSLYLYSPGQETVYFDNFRVIRYKSVIE